MTSAAASLRIPSGSLGIQNASAPKRSFKVSAAPQSSKILFRSSFVSLNTREISSLNPLTYSKATVTRNICNRANNLVCQAVLSLPQTAEQATTQAIEAIKSGFEQGLTRQQVTVLLPTDQRRKNYMFTEGLEYPDNAASVYQTAGAVATSILKGLGVNGEIQSQRIDDDGMDGEPVGVFCTNEQDVLVIILPTADTLQRIRELEKKQDRKIVLLNPQWKTKGNIVSDFGFGPWKRRAEEFVAKFVSTYSLTEQRIGAASTLDPVTGDYMGLGGVVRILQSYSAQVQTFSIGQDGSSECIAFTDEVPTYQEFEKIVAESRTSLKSKRQGDTLEKESDRLVKNEAERAAAGSQTGTDFSLKSGAEVAAAVQAGAISKEDVAKMDKVPLRAALNAWGLPSSGKVETLRSRLIDAMEKELM